MHSVVDENGKLLDSGNLCCWFTLQCGFLYSDPGHPFVKHCKKELYENGQRSFLKTGGGDNGFVIDLAMMNQLRKWNVKYRDEKQLLDDGILLYDSTVLATRHSKNKNSYLIHWFDQSWKKTSFKQIIKHFVKSHLYWLYRLQ